MELKEKRCVPCEGGIPKLDERAIAELAARVSNWRVEGERLKRSWTRRNFLHALSFVNAIGFVAEQEGHHPDIAIRGWNHVDVEIWTHAIGGLSENDFILAAKIDALETPQSAVAS